MHKALYSVVFLSLLFLANNATSKVSLLKTNTNTKSTQNPPQTNATSSTSQQTNTATVTTYQAPQPSRSQTNSDDDRFFFINGPCVQTTCHMPFSFCASPTQCVCNQGYAHKPDSTSQQPSQANQNVNCTYQQKRQMSAFLLEFFFPFGAGHFYSQRSLPGALKLVLFMFYCIGFCVFNSIKTPGEALFDMSVRMKMVGVCVSCLCCGLFIWQIADLISFGANSYRDGEGVPLASW